MSFVRLRPWQRSQEVCATCARRATRAVQWPAEDYDFIAVAAGQAPPPPVRIEFACEQHYHALMYEDRGWGCGGSEPIRDGWKYWAESLIWKWKSAT